MKLIISFLFCTAASFTSFPWIQRFYFVYFFLRPILQFSENSTIFYPLCKARTANFKTTMNLNNKLLFCSDSFTNFLWVKWIFSFFLECYTSSMVFSFSFLNNFTNLKLLTLKLFSIYWSMIRNSALKYVTTNVPLLTHIRMTRICTSSVFIPRVKLLQCKQSQNNSISSLCWLALNTINAFLSVFAEEEGKYSYFLRVVVFSNSSSVCM